MQAPRQAHMQALRCCSLRAQQPRQQELRRRGLQRQRSRHRCPLAPSRSHRLLSCRRSRQTCAASGWRRSALLPVLLLWQRRTGRVPHSWLRWAWRRQGWTWRPASMAARHPAAEPCGHGRRRWRLRCSAASSRAAEPGNGQGSGRPGVRRPVQSCMLECFPLSRVLRWACSRPAHLLLRLSVHCQSLSVCCRAHPALLACLQVPPQREPPLQGGRAPPGEPRRP